MRERNSGHRFYELDLLRFVAASSVLLFHYGFRGYAADNLTTMQTLWLAPVAKYGGILGVHLFFMISGFVILMSAKHGSARRFVLSRLLRLYPTFWMCCTMTYLALLWAADAPSLSAYAVNMTMLNGLFGIPPVDGSYWTLTVELEFYFLVLLVLIFRQAERADLFCGLWVMISLAAHAIHSPWLNSLYLVSYGPLFAAGALFYLTHDRGPSCYRSFLLAVCFLLACVRAVAEGREDALHYHVPVSPVVLVGAVTCFFAAFSFVALGRSGRLGSRSWFAWGALTYPLYLLHQQLGFIIFSRIYPRIPAPAVLAGTICLMLLVSKAVDFVSTRIRALAASHALVG